MANIASFNSLPKFVAQEIFLYAGPESMASCSLVCKGWNKLIENKYFLNRINQDYITFCNSNRQILENESIALFEATTDKILSKVCMNTVPFSEEKALEKVDQFLSSLFLKKNTTTAKRVYWCFFRNPDILLQLKEQMENTEISCIFKIIPKKGGVQTQDLNGRDEYSMVTSPSHKINFYLRDYGYFKSNNANRLINMGLKKIIFKHIDTIESRWLNVDPSKITIYNVTVHQETAFRQNIYIIRQNIYIIGKGARVWAGRRFEHMNWEKTIPLEWTKGHNWTCKLQRYSEEPVQFKIMFSESVWADVDDCAWEIIDNDPLKNRVINVGDSKEIYLDNLTFQK